MKAVLLESAKFAEKTIRTIQEMGADLIPTGMFDGVSVEEKREKQDSFILANGIALGFTFATEFARKHGVAVVQPEPAESKTSDAYAKVDAILSEAFKAIAKATTLEDLLKIVDDAEKALAKAISDDQATKRQRPAEVR